MLFFPGLSVWSFGGKGQVFFTFFFGFPSALFRGEASDLSLDWVTWVFRAALLNLSKVFWVFAREGWFQTSFQTLPEDKSSAKSSLVRFKSKNLVLLGTRGFKA